jgi:hypothetical protein
MLMWPGWTRGMKVALVAVAVACVERAPTAASDGAGQSSSAPEMAAAAQQSVSVSSAVSADAPERMAPRVDSELTIRELREIER